MFTPPLIALLLLPSCAPVEVVDRQVGDRTPLSDVCDPMDASDCHLPWPSNTFTEAADTHTGLQLALDPGSLAVEDDPSFMNTADGFSRVAPILASFSGLIEPGPEAMRLFVAEPDHPRYGEEIPLELSVVGDDFGARSLLVGYPRRPMPADADHVVVVMDDLGAEQIRTRRAQLALGLVEPTARDEDEAAAVGYYAPVRSFLAEAGIDPAGALMAWDFTTRSQDDATKRLLAMTDALEVALSEGEMDVAFDSLSTTSAEEIAAIVRGRLVNAPAFLDDDDRLVLDGDGLPVTNGTREIEFRVAIPAGEGDYRITLYGHGTGGDVYDSTFDEQLCGSGVAKVGLRWDGWTGDDLLMTLADFYAVLSGAEKSTARLLQALAGGMAVLTALEGPLGEALAAETIDGEANPASGRYPDTSIPLWTGGSMGGTMGSVIVSADDRIQYGVLNVPGGGWTHMIPASLLYETAMKGLLVEQYGGPIEAIQILLMSQGAWDDIDGAIWAEEALAAGGMFLLQESMEDPIMPNRSTELLAAAFEAVQFDPDLSPILDLPHTDGEVRAGAALEQFRVPYTGEYDVHGFAARETIAGDAAMQQIEGFIESIWSGAPTIEHPSICVEEIADGSCDFSEAWEE